MCKLDKLQSGSQSLMDSVGQVVEMINTQTPHTATHLNLSTVKKISSSAME